MLLRLVFLVTLAHVARCAPSNTLKLVNMLYRHGDRSPAYIYPKDKHQLWNTWPDGYGWLTNIGKQQQYELGQYLNQRYSGFLNTSRYQHTEIHIEASAVQRCLMSAYSNLAGLFPPQGDQVWSQEILWQPIPVQTRPLLEDNKLALKAPCPRYDQLYQEMIHSPTIRKDDIDNKDFYDMIENKTGIKKESIADIWQLADDLICENAHNLTWNDWAYEDGVWKRLNKLRVESFDLLYNMTEMAKLKGGPLLKEVIANMQTAIKQSSIYPKVYMYSAHDTTVAAFLTAMKMFDSQQPPYASTVMVELHLIDNVHEVKIFYRNDSTTDPYELVPKGCAQRCTLESFIKATKDTVPANWTAECVAHNSSASLSTASWIALAISACILILIIVIFAASLVRHCRKTSIVYANL